MPHDLWRRPLPIGVTAEIGTAVSRCRRGSIRSTVFQECHADQARLMYYFLIAI